MFKVVFGLCEAVFLVGVARAHYSGVEVEELIPAAGSQTGQLMMILLPIQSFKVFLHLGLFMHL